MSNAKIIEVKVPMKKIEDKLDIVVDALCVLVRTKTHFRVK